MKLRKLPYELSICKVESMTDVNTEAEFFFVGKTHDELSLVCLTDDVPERTVNREDGWKCFCIEEGILDFSLVGILSEISSLLAKNGIGIFAASTYNTDYFLVKAKDFAKAIAIMETSGHTFIEASTSSCQ